MPTMTDFTEEKQRLSDQLAKVDAERSKLQDRLNELEVTERVLSRFGKSKGDNSTRGRAAKAQPGRAEVNGPRPSGKSRKAPRTQGKAVPLGEATFQAVKAHPRGASAEAVRSYITKEFGLQVRPNHLGMALQRHRRAGRLEVRDSLWHAV
ncbi:MAG: hypothetical protein WA633_09785 [Stellaceae bacterium]